jgi:hypothetical protein
MRQFLWAKRRISALHVVAGMHGALVFLARLIDCSCCSVSAPIGAKNVNTASTRGNHVSSRSRFLIYEISALEFAASASSLTSASPRAPC